MKTCFKCGETKALDEFYVHPEMADGHMNKCKVCTRKDTHVHRLQNLEHFRAYDRSRGNRQGSEYTKFYRVQNPEKSRAHQLINKHVRSGKIQRPEACTSCGRVGHLEGHHEDYSRPLDVIWLCSPCHRAKHKKAA